MDSRHEVIFHHISQINNKPVMASSSTAVAFVLFLVGSCFAGAVVGIVYESGPFNRSDFPPGFLFGAASAAFQYEGAASEGGRKPSIWDTYTHKFPEKIADRSNADVAIDFYHRYKDDVKLLKYLGFDVFRMSISWSRVLPRGKLSEGVNKEGIAFYNNLINELLANGITPFVTIFHWDLPQTLEDEYKGLLSPHIVDDYKDYADLCFKEFGDRVKHWITFNEPFATCNGGYDGEFFGNYAPYRCSTCSQGGDSAREPYIAAHYLLLSHAAAVNLYNTKYKPIQKGEIGITLVTPWFVPYSNNSLDIRAARRALDFVFGWFMHPVVYGDYPRNIKAVVRDRLPKFTVKQKASLKGSFDFIGINYYTGFYAAHIVSRSGNTSNTKDQMTSLSSEINGVPIGEPTGISIFYSFPKGFHDLLVYTMKKYNNPKIYITETGLGEPNNETSVENGINDPMRIDFYNRHLHALRKAMEQGVNVKGFMAWSFLDNFEWTSGYTIRFGICYVDYKNGLKRILKKSALWFRKGLIKK